MRNADVAMWHACAVAETWHAGMQIVLVGTHLTKTHQAKTKKQSGACADPMLFHPQHLNGTCRHCENRHHKMCAHLCVCCRARLPCVPGCCEKYAATWGGTHCEIAVHMQCAGGVCSWAGRACGVGQMASNSHAAGVGGKCGAV